MSAVAELERRYDPSQKRDRKGRWAGHVLASESATFGGHRIDLEARHDRDLKWEEERQVHVTVHTADGPQQIILSSANVHNLAGALRQPPAAVRRQVGERYNPGNLPEDVTPGFVGLRRLGDDRFQLNFASGDDLVASIEADGKDLGPLAGVAQRVASADSLETRAGLVTLQGLKDGRWVASLPATTGEPVQVRMYADELPEIGSELRKSLDEFETSGTTLVAEATDPDEPDEYADRDFAADELTGGVQLSGTTLYWDVTGKPGKGVVHLHSTAHDWSLDLTTDQAADLADMLTGLSDGITSDDLARHDEHQLAGLAAVQRAVHDVMATLDEDEAEELLAALVEVDRARHVRTAAGVKKYGLPIGSLIGSGSKRHGSKVVGRAKEHARGVTSGMGIHTGSLTAELDRQAEMTPKSMLRLRQVRYSNDSDESFRGHVKPIAVYVGERFREWDGKHHTVVVNSAWASQGGSMDRAFLINMAHDTGHFTPAHAVRSELPGVGSALTNSLAHEYGHHLTDLWGDDPEHPGFQRVRAIVAEALPGTTVFDGQDFDRWLRRNKKAIATAVSGYATESFAEFLAEVWAEYSTTGDDARPHIKQIGDVIREVAEEYA